MQMTSTYQLTKDIPHQKIRSNYVSNTFHCQRYSKTRNMENSIQSNKSHKQVNVTILIFSKVDFELKLIRWENINIDFKERNKLPRRYKNVYLCTKSWSSQFHKTNTKKHEKSDMTRYNTLFWLPFSPLDRSSKLKSGKDLNYTTNQLDLTDLQNISQIGPICSQQ